MFYTTKKQYQKDEGSLKEKLKNIIWINAIEKRCKERSKIGYAITSYKYMETMKSMEIDEEKLYGLYKL